MNVEDELNQLTAQHRGVLFYAAFGAAFRTLARQGSSITLDELSIRVLQAEREAAPNGATFDSVDNIRRLSREVLRKLDRNRSGRLVLGRRGKPTRFDVATQALEELARSGAAEQAKTADYDSASPIRHAFTLRPDFPVVLELPRDLTRAEAGRLARFTESLSFEGAA